MHLEVVREYQAELLALMYASARAALPDVALIQQQPELKTSLRGPLLDFLFKVAKRTKVAGGIFYKAARLMDRYCLKRVVLRDQAQLVAGTCLWLAAKTLGGCNHVINLLLVPPGGRFVGPTARLRIPRLSELVQLCGPSCGYDEGMFIQMERHILDTLAWEVCDALVFNWCFGMSDFQILDRPETADDRKVATIKAFLVDALLYLLDLVQVHPQELAHVIKKILVTLVLNDSSFLGISAGLLPRVLARDDRLAPGEFNMALANRLLLAVANCTQTVLTLYSADKDAGEAILKIHKAAISHIMALHEEACAKEEPRTPPRYVGPVATAAASPGLELDFSDADLVISGDVRSRLGGSVSSSVSSVSVLPVYKRG